MKIDMTLLPPVARECVAHIGLPATLELIRVKGGVTINLSGGSEKTGAASFAELAEIVGEDNARTLAKQMRSRFSNGKMPVPRCRSALLAVRNQQVIHEYDTLTQVQHHTDREACAVLARKYGVTDRYIHILLKRTGTDAGQIVDSGQFCLF